MASDILTHGIPHIGGIILTDIILIMDGMVILIMEVIGVITIMMIGDGAMVVTEITIMEEEILFHPQVGVEHHEQQEHLKLKQEG